MAVFFDCQFLEMFLHVFLQYWKLDRTDFKKILVKSFWIKVVAEYSLPFCLQIKKTEISPAVFQIIGGRFHDILEISDIAFVFVIPKSFSNLAASS